MALAAAAAAARTTVAPRGLGALFSTVSSGYRYTPVQTQVEKPPPAEPSTNLFVSGLSKRTTSEGLQKAFEPFGEVVRARVVRDHVSGFSKGFGFVRYSTLEGAAAGIKGMDGQFLDGWVIFAEYARPRENPPPLNNNNSNSYGGPFNGNFNR